MLQLGIEAQRQWSPRAIVRATLPAHPHRREQSGPIRQAAWSRKRAPTFADAPASVRGKSWAHATSRMPSDDAAMVPVPHALMERLTETRCSVA